MTVIGDLAADILIYIAKYNMWVHVQMRKENGIELPMSEHHL